MVNPLRPQDVSGLYRQQAASTPRAGTPGEPEAATGGAGGVRRGRRADQVMLSDEARQLRRVLAALGDVPEVREDRVAALRAQIDAGTYDRDVLQIATRMVEDGHFS